MILTWEEDGRTKISDKMGYVSTVDDARKMLEDLYKLKDNKEKLKLLFKPNKQSLLVIKYIVKLIVCYNVHNESLSKTTMLCLKRNQNIMLTTRSYLKH